MLCSADSNSRLSTSDSADMDLPEAPSSDPEIKPGLVKTREYAAVVSPACSTVSVSVICERKPAEDAAASTTCEDT